MTSPIPSWLLPLLAWAATPIVLTLAVRRRGFFRWWGIAAGLSIAADAWLNLGWSPLPAGSAAATVAAVAFVVLGDLRYFATLTWDGRSSSLVVAFALASIVPLATQGLRMALPSLGRDPRQTFLAYEGLMLALLVVLRPRANRPTDRALHAFELTQYGLWAGVDALLLASSPAWAPAWLALRFLPDALYYVAFVPYVLVRSGR